MPSALTATGERAAGRRGAQRLGQAAVDQQRRVDAVGEVAQLLDRRPGRARPAARASPCRAAGVVGDDVLGQAQVHGQRHQVLLGAVVQVALDPAALGVAGRDDAGPRFAQLVGLLAQLIQGGLQGGVELHVVEGEADLAGQLGQHAVVLLGEGVRLGRAFHHDQAEQLAAVADRRHAQLGPLPAVEQRGQPDRGPGVAGDARPGHHRALALGRSGSSGGPRRAPTRRVPAPHRRPCRPRPGSGPWSCAATRRAGAAARPWRRPGSSGCRRCGAPRPAPRAPRRRTGWPRPAAGPGPAGSRPPPPPRRASTGRGSPGRRRRRAPARGRARSRRRRRRRRG